MTAFSTARFLKDPRRKNMTLCSCFSLFLCVIFAASCASNAAAAEEYYSIGMAYYELGKFQEAESWLTRASSMDKTMTASEYNLGRIAFASGRYEDAAKHFEKMLARDPDNVMALKGAAYSRIKNGDLSRARAYYGKVLEMVPESADDGYNYALVLYALGDYAESEETLTGYGYALEEKSDAALLLARAQKAQNKPEAADSYAKWLVLSPPSNPQALYEYAGVLENLELFAKAIEQYRAAGDALAQDTETLTKAALAFDVARLLLTADPENPDGLKELDTAVAAGFKDTDLLGTLLEDSRITNDNKTGIQEIINIILNPPAPEAETALESNPQAGSDAQQE
jgi:tetratricopeptide (TPR) repeat protein